MGHYQADTSTTPIQLDLTLAGGESILTIVEFVDDDTVHMENTNPGDPRPTSFSDYLELYRVSPWASTDIFSRWESNGVIKERADIRTY